MYRHGISARQIGATAANLDQIGGGDTRASQPHPDHLGRPIAPAAAAEYFRDAPSLAVIIARMLQAAWRRRLPLMVPIMLMIPLSIAVALLLPRQYAATTLLVLPDLSRNNPLAGPNRMDRVQERISGLQALLTSDAVLQQVLNDTGDTSTGKQRELRLENLRQNTRLNLVGIDFLEIRITDPVATGLGVKVAALTKRFTDALLSTGLLSSADALVIVDAPRDPTFANRSRLVYVLIGAVAGVMMGILLAVAAESLDPVIRNPDEAAALAGAPILARLPTFVQADSAARVRRLPPTRSYKFSLVRLFAAAVLTIVFVMLPLIF